MPDKIRFFLDENVPRAVADGLQLRGVDVVTVEDAGRRGIDDGAQLEFAAAQGRVLFTQDEDFLVLHAEGRSHAGIAYARQNSRSIGQMVQGLMLIYQVLDPEEMHNRVEYL